MKILALDLGEKTVGMAVSDSGLFARPVGTWPRKGAREDLAALAERVSASGVEVVLIGIPLHMSGDSSQASERARRFARRLRGRVGVPVVGVDERFTTVGAKETSVGLGAGRAFDDHAVAAAMILQRYIDEGEHSVVERW